MKNNIDYRDFIEDERRFYLHEAGFNNKEAQLFKLRVYEDKTLWEAAEIMEYSPRQIDRINKKMKEKIRKAAPMYHRGISFEYN
jgi:DNA-directed RNA polymerase specialized sigma subunit